AIPLLLRGGRGAWTAWVIVRTTLRRGGDREREPDERVLRARQGDRHRDGRRGDAGPRDTGAGAARAAARDGPHPRRDVLDGRRRPRREPRRRRGPGPPSAARPDRKSTRLNSSHVK